MDLKRIAYLIQVAESGSFSKAATVIGIAQPALGRQVQKLEEECGVRLLYRHGRGVSLTPEGERFISGVRPLLRQLDAVANDLRDEQQSVAGVVTLGLTPTMANLMGLKLINSLREKYPRLQLHIVSGYSGYIHEWLIDARLDIAILHDARRSQHLAVEPLGDAKLFLVSAPQCGGLEAGVRSLHFRELEGLPLALPTKNHGLRRTMEFAAGRAGFELNITYEVDTLSLMKEIAVAGLAHTVLAIPAIQAEVEQGRLLARQLCEPEIETRLVVAKSANRPVTRAVRVLEQEIRNVFRRAMLEAPYDLGLKVSA